MLAILPFVVLAASAPAPPVAPAAFETPTLHIAVGAVPTQGAMRLRSPLLESVNARADAAWTASDVMRGAQSSAPAPANGAAPAAGGEASAPAAGGEASAPAAGGEAAAEEPEPSIDLMRHRRHLTRLHKPLGIATWAMLAATEVIGTMLAINQPTLFGSGFCAHSDGFAVLGTFGCDGSLTALHEASAFITVGFYATTGIFALSMPDPEHASVGNDERARTLRLHKMLAVVHLVGMVLEPILGILAVNPSLVGVPISARSDFSSAMRTVHLGVGYVTFGALSAAMYLEL